MQSGNIVLRIAVRLARFVGCFSDPPARPALTLSGQALPFVSFRASSRRAASERNERSRTRAERASPAATSIRHFIRRTGGRALERAKLKGFQFDKALSANFSSEQLTGINSRFFFHRSRTATPLTLVGATLSRERRRTRERISRRSAGATLCTTSYLI